MPRSRPAAHLRRTNTFRPRHLPTVTGLVLVILPVLALGGCSSRPDARTTGFLSNESALADVSRHERTFVAPPDEVADIDAILIDPIAFRLPADESENLSSEDRAALASAMTNAVREALQEDFEIADRSGPGVARLRIAITGLRKATPLLNLHPGTRLSGAGAGAAAMEGELVDAMSGAVLWATVRSDLGPRLGFDGLSAWGDAEAVMKQWAKDLRQDLAGLDPDLRESQAAVDDARER